MSESPSSDGRATGALIGALVGLAASAVLFFEEIGWMLEGATAGPLVSNAKLALLLGTLIGGVVGALTASPQPSVPALSASPPAAPSERSRVSLSRPLLVGLVVFLVPVLGDGAVTAWESGPPSLLLVGLCASGALGLFIWFGRRHVSTVTGRLRRKGQRGSKVGRQIGILRGDVSEFIRTTAEIDDEKGET